MTHGTANEAIRETAPEPGTGAARVSLLFLALCALLTLLAYAPVLDAPWYLDDIPHVVENTGITGDSLLPVFTRTFWGQPPGAASTWSYRPVASLVTRLVYQACASPLCSRSVNLLLHIAFSLGLYALLRRWFPGLASALAAGAFMIHPIHAETVVFAVGRADILAALFSLTAFAGYLKRRYILMLAAFALALFSKENAALLLPLLLAHALLTRRFPRPLGYATFTVPFLLVGFLNLALHRMASGRWWETVAEVQNPLVLAAGAERWAHAFSFPARYLARIFWPSGIPADYSLGAYPLVPWHDPALLAAAAASLLIPLAAGLTAFYRPRLRGLAAGIGAFYILALVAFQWHSLGTFVLTDRHMYLPLAGLAASLAALVQVAWTGSADALPVAGRRIAGVLCLLLPLLGLGMALFSTIPAYAGPVTLARAWLANSPGGARAALMLGNEAARQGHPELALAHLDAALEAHPAYYEARLARAKVLSELGREQEAGALFAELYRSFPDDADTTYSYAAWLWRTGALAEARQVLFRAVATHPDHYLIRLTLGRLTDLMDGPAAGLPHVEHACRLKPDPLCTRIAADLRSRLGRAVSPLPQP